MAIKVLNKKIAEQIAAGEVIESPASVVKELVENSLDASATEIDIAIEDGGKKLIAVTDNGEGLTAKDLVLAFERYATSKISTFDDLLRLSSLGFRGEALPSIASVSSIKMVTRRKEDLSGSCLVIAGSEILEQDETGTAPGTTIAVKDLFFNTPARLKFLRSNTVETAKISSLVTEMALIHPHVSFKLRSNNRLLLQTRGDDNLLHVIDSVYGKDVREKMIEVNNSNSEQNLAVNGYISAPSLTRTARRWITLAVNKRLVHDNQVIFQLMRAYGDILPSRRYPVAVIYLSVPPKIIDVNVHPAKTEIRFAEPEIIKSFIYQSAKRSLISYRTLPSWSGHNFHGDRFNKETATYKQDIIRETYPVKTINTEKEVGIKYSEAVFTDQAPGSIGQIKLLGQFLNSYIVAQKDDELIIIDQHAAHERLLYYELKEERNKKTNLVKQQLTVPVPIDLPTQWSEMITELMPLLQEHGFDIEPLSDNSYAVRAIPTIYYGQNEGALVYSFLEDLFAENFSSMEEAKDKILKTIACHRSIKAKQALSRIEMEHLLYKWEKVTGFQYCPHGRPVVIGLKKEDLDKQFKRWD